MPRYAILIYEDEAAYETPGAVDEVMRDHDLFKQRNPVLPGGIGLLPTSTARSIRRDSLGGFMVTDGAFVETKEAVGGFYLIEAADLEQAIAVAKQVPARFGGLEVRELVDELLE